MVKVSLTVSSQLSRSILWNAHYHNLLVSVINVISLTLVCQQIWDTSLQPDYTMSKCGIRSLFTTFTSKYDIAILLGLILYLADIISDLAVFGQLLYEEKYLKAKISIVLIVTPNVLFAFFCILDKADGVIDRCKNFLEGLVTLQVMCPNTPSTKIVSVILASKICFQVALIIQFISSCSYYDVSKPSCG